MGVMVSSCGIASSCLFVLVIVAGEIHLGAVTLVPGGAGWREVVRRVNRFLLAWRSIVMRCSRRWRGDIVVEV